MNAEASSSPKMNQHTRSAYSLLTATPAEIQNTFSFKTAVGYIQLTAMNLFMGAAREAEATFNNQLINRNSNVVATF